MVTTQDVFFKLLLIGDIDGAVKELQMRRQQIARTGRSAQVRSVYCVCSEKAPTPPDRANVRC